VRFEVRDLTKALETERSIKKQSRKK
jgi:predicted GIY-YIG superfamily endonuclease